MKTASPGYLLKQRILEKEAECQEEGKLLRDQFHQAYECLKPINVLKNTYKELIAVPGIKTSIFNVVIGFTAGHLAKTLFSGGSRNPIKIISGIILEMVVANSVIKNADEFKTIGSRILNKTIHRHDDPVKG